jgi:hypothetical protein
VIIAMEGLLGGFILVLLLLSYLMIKTRISPLIKLIVVVVVSVFYWVQYQSLLQYRGWPTTASLPDEFVLIATEVHEPELSKGDEGVMYWWVRESGNPKQPPRVYQLPYQVEIHEKTQEVVREQKQGAQYVGKSGSAVDSNSRFGVSFERISKANRYKKE